MVFPRQIATDLIPSSKPKILFRLFYHDIKKSSGSCSEILRGFVAAGGRFSFFFSARVGFLTLFVRVMALKDLEAIGYVNTLGGGTLLAIRTCPSEYVLYVHFWIKAAF